MRHRFHSLCPYFAMFPENFVRKYLVWTSPGELVFDPFCGRGTTIFESLLNGRPAFGCDVNPVAVCVSNAKADPPRLNELLERLDELQTAFAHQTNDCRSLAADEFFGLCFDPVTLRELLWLRSALRWKQRRADRFIAALVLGCLHGESHRSASYLSNRMPRTISTKPDYSVRWWKARKLVPPRRDVFRILRNIAEFRFASTPARRRGRVKQVDARKAISSFPDYEGKVSLLLTSPPYLDTTNFEEDQWLRLWFLGGPPKPTRSAKSDDRYFSSERYWDFLAEAWGGVGPLLKRNAHVVIRIGGKRLSINEVEGQLHESLEEGFERRVHLIESRTTKIRGGQLRAFRPGADGVVDEHDFHFIVGP